MPSDVLPEMRDPGVEQPPALPLWYSIAVVAILLIAAYLRTWEITLRPLHSDEGVNFLFVEYTNKDGFYRYSHENYHGPLFFYCITGLVNLLGDSEFGLRAASMLFGLLTVGGIFWCCAREGSTFAILAALLVALSPSQVFFSRYAIHETLLVLATFIFGWSLYEWTRGHKRVCWYVAAFALAIMITTKETFLVAVFCAGLGLLAQILPTPFGYSESPSPSYFTNFRMQWDNARRQWSHIITALLFCSFLVLCTFSGGFRWSDGIREMVLAIPQWIGRSSSDVGHVKPFWYYVQQVIAVTEPTVILGTVLALIGWAIGLITHHSGLGRVDLTGRHRALFRFLIPWTVSSFLVYSFIPYKTVWLVINVTLPAALLTAAVLAVIMEAPRTHLLGAGLSALTAAVTYYQCCKYNYIDYPILAQELPPLHGVPYGQQNPFSYVHTSQGMLDLVKKADMYWKENPKARVLVGVGGYFPLPYYFRKHATQLGYIAPENINIDEMSRQYDVLILDFYKHHWSNPEWTQDYYRLSDFSETTTFWRRLPGHEHDRPPSSSPPP